LFDLHLTTLLSLHLIQIEIRMSFLTRNSLFKSSHLSNNLFFKKMFSKQKVVGNGIDFSYVKVGSGKEVVLLLPGALGTAKSDFSPQLANFNGDKFTTIALELRGYGSSRPPQRDFPVNFYQRDALDALAVMEKLGFDKYSLLGWSDGGNSACMMAAQRPEHINKLVIWGSNSYVTPQEKLTYQSLRDVSTWSEKMRKPLEEEYGFDYFEKTWHQFCDVFMEMPTNEKGIINLYQEELCKIKAETLIIHGMKDRLVPEYHCNYLNENITNSKLIKWDDGAHNLHLRHFERFNKLVQEFLEEKC